MNVGERALPYLFCLAALVVTVAVPLVGGFLAANKFHRGLVLAGLSGLFWSIVWSVLLGFAIQCTWLAVSASEKRWMELPGCGLAFIAVILMPITFGFGIAGGALGGARKWRTPIHVLEGNDV